MATQSTAPTTSPGAKVLREFRVITRDLASRLSLHIPPGQFGRYLLVGTWNTVFGYSTFAAFTALLKPYVAASYIPASVLSGILNISVAYLGYKRFVFKTKGNYLQEWVRCMGVYGSGILLGVCILPVFVWFIRRATSFDRQAPYIAGAILSGFNVIYNFVGNKKFSFKTVSGMDGNTGEV